MAAGQDLGSLWVSITVDASKVGPAVEAAGKEARGKFRSSTKGMGRELGDDIEGSLKGRGTKIGSDLGSKLGKAFGDGLGKSTDKLQVLDGLMKGLRDKLQTAEPWAKKFGIDISGWSGSLDGISGSLKPVIDNFDSWKANVELASSALGALKTAAPGFSSSILDIGAAAAKAAGEYAGFVAMLQLAQPLIDKVPTFGPGQKNHFDAAHDATHPWELLPWIKHDIVKNVPGPWHNSNDPRPDEVPKITPPSGSTDSGLGSVGTMPDSVFGPGGLAGLGLSPLDKARGNHTRNDLLDPGHMGDLGDLSPDSIARLRYALPPTMPNLKKLNTSHAQKDTIAAADEIQQKFGLSNIGMYRKPDGFNEHSSGEAADVMIPNSASPAGIAQGTAVKDYALANADRLGIKYVLWHQRQWNPDGSSSAMEDRGGATANHMDHVHIRTAGGGYMEGDGPGAPGSRVPGGGGSSGGSRNSGSSGGGGGGSGGSGSSTGGGGGGGGGGGPLGTQGDPIYVLPAGVGAGGGSGGRGGMSGGGKGMPGASDMGNGLAQMMGLDGSVFSGFGGSSGNPMDFGVTSLFQNLMGAVGGGDGSALPGPSGLMPGAGEAISSGVSAGNGVGPNLGPANNMTVHGDNQPTNFTVNQSGVDGSGVPDWKQAANAIAGGRAGAMTTNGAGGHGR